MLEVSERIKKCSTHFLNFVTGSHGFPCDLGAIALLNSFRHFFSRTNNGSVIYSNSFSAQQEGKNIFSFFLITLFFIY